MKKILLLSLVFVLSFIKSWGQISGVVYKDFNANGTRQTTVPNNEPGVAGIIVNAYDASNALLTTTTSSSTGAYSMPYTVPVRVEFVIPTSDECVSTSLDYTGFSGDGNNIRFVSASTSTLDYGILSPDEYTVDTNPFVYVPYYTAGDPLGGGTSGSTPGYIGYTYNSATTPASLKAIPQSSMGAVWGGTYSKQAKKIFTSAFVKRQVGLGPMGSGGIYMLEPTASSFNVTQFYDMDANGYRTRAASGAVAYGSGTSYSIASGTTITYIGATDPESGFPEGLGVIGTNAQRGLPADMTADSYDAAAFDQIGKVGLGDIEISDDGKFLFVMNLYSRKLYRLELNDAYNPTSIVSVTSFAIPTIAVSNGELRPFAVSYHRGKIYIGVVASGENGGVNNVGGATDLYAYVFEMTDPNGAAAFNSTPILTQALNYQKGFAIQSLSANAEAKKWHPWSKVSSQYISDGGEFTWSSPILSNIDWTDRGDMILDFFDRGGHQYGYNNFTNLNASGPVVNSAYDVSGDILIAGKNCNTGNYTIENNGSYSSNGNTLTSAGASNTQGPGNGEFFYQEIPPDNYHQETSQGALAIVPGSSAGIFTLMDANSSFSGGTARFSTENGLASNRLTLYGNTDGTFSKANGLGDIEVAGDEPPIELGNRVWLDANANGIQDAGEVGIANVTVELFCDFDNDQIPDGAAIGFATTDASGHWYFNTSNVADGDCSLAGNQAGPQPNKTYIVRIESSDWTGGIGVGDLNLLSLSNSNVPVVGISDASDNDATLVATIPQIQMNTGKLGKIIIVMISDSKACSADAGSDAIIDCITTSVIIGTTANPGDTYSWAPGTGLSSTSIAQPTASPSTTTTYTLTVNGLCTDEVTITVNTTAPTADAGTTQNLDCNTTSATIGTTAIVGNTYAWLPSTGLSSATDAMPTASPSSTTTYTVTVTGSNGCTATSTVTVNVNTTAPTADAGSTQNLDCNTTSATIGTIAIVGNTYAWLPATGLSSTTDAMPTASPTSTTTYTVTVTSSNGCTATSTVTVNVNTTAPTADAGSTLNLNCTTTSGAIGTTAIVGNTYAWLPAIGLSSATDAQPSASPTSTTTYTVTVTSSNGCTATSTVTVNVNTTAPTADAGSTLNLNCTTTSGAIGTTAIVGNTYAWLPATGLSSATDAQPTASPTSTTTYTVTVTGSNGCTATSTVTVNVNTTAPTADAGSTLNLNCTTTSGTIGTTAIVGNTYAWLPATGLSSTTDAMPTASPTSTTTYTVTVTGSNGCTATSTVTVNVNTTAPTADAGSTLNLNCTTTSGAIGTTAIVGNTYAWLPATGLSSTTDAQPTASPTSTTTYTVTVTGSNGCTATSTVTVNVNSTAPTADAGSTLNLNCTTTSGTIGTTAIVGNTYAWLPATGLSSATDAMPTASPSSTTTYTVTVTGSNGCTATSTVTVNVNTTAPSATITGITDVCNGGTTTITANGGVSYVWDNAALTPSIIVSAGTYTVTATGANGCTATSSVTVNTVEGKIGNYVWYDINGNGINDELSTSGINGLSVELWKETSSGSNVFVLDQTTTTADDVSFNPGYYNFTICESSNYKVKFPLTSGGQKLTAQTITPNTDNNNDANPTDGFSTIVTIDVNGVGAAKENYTIDAAYYQAAQLGNYVWNDINKDGIQDVNEVGVAGISVTLYDNSNAIISNTITDAYGYYKFNPLPSGNYHVGFTLPANYIFTLQDATTDALDNDVNPLTGLTGNYVIALGDSNMTVDAGIYFQQPTTASVGNFVWLDINKDGIQDAGEEGISGVTVTLKNNLGVTIATTITNADGYYIFTDVDPGTYSVGFTTPPGLTFSPNTGVVSSPFNSDADPVTGMTSTFTVIAGDEITYVDAGLYSISLDFPLLGGLGDKVWYDANQNGIQDAGELGVQGVTVTLYQADGITIISTATTNAYGDYIFNTLSAGQYVVGFSNLPANYALTINTGTDSTTNSDANTGTGKTPIISLAPGQYNMTYDAGIYNTLPANNNSIGDFVWNDLNKDGVQDIGEQGVPGVTVTLYDNTNTVISITSTNSNGYYSFPDLPNGTYYVGFSNLPLGYVFSPTGNGTSATDSDPDKETGLTSSVTLVGNTHITDLDAGVNLGNTKIGLGTLGDLVWYDLNNNGLQDVNESGVQGVLVTLYEQDGTTVISTTTTNALGNYIFTGLDAGNYVVGFTNLPSGFTIATQNSDAEGINGELNSDVNSLTQKTDIISLGTGEDKMSVDMGLVPPVGSASLGNLVWFDLNNDGLQTSGEPGVQGITVTLYNSIGGIIATTNTNNEGEYYFVGLAPATYSVGFTNLPSGYTFTTEDADLNGIIGTTNSDANSVSGLTNSVTLGIGENNLNLDAGIVSSIVASVGDYVWFDTDRDGIQDPNEIGIGGVLVTLYNSSNTAVASAITDPNGAYIFTNVIPGDYTIGFSNIPSGMEFTQQVGLATDNDNSNVNPLTGLTASFTVVGGTHNPTIDAGLKTPVNAGLGNYVWHDVNENGLQDASEPGVSGVLVTLYASDGTSVLATASTDGNGAYSFTNLPAETYIVGFSNLPIGSTRTSSIGAINDPLNSDMNLGGKTNSITLTEGEYNPTIDAGIYFGIPLPAKELVATLAVIKNTTSCEVNWYTADELNTNYFIIERSVNSQDFVAVGNRKASKETNGKTNYMLVDDIASVATATIIYYRIVLVDIDGKKTVSNTISVKPRANNGDLIVVYPSPFTNKLLVDFTSFESSDLQIQLTDVSGRVIAAQMSSVEAGLNHITISNLEALSEGQYFIKIKDLNTSEVYIRSIVK